MKIQRREFLKRSAIGLGGMLIGARLGALEAPSTPAPASSIPRCFDPFERVALGKTGLESFPALHGHRTPVAFNSNRTKPASVATI